MDLNREKRNVCHLPLETSIDRLYRNRFQPKTLERRDAVWKVLCGKWLTRYIPRNASVLEIGAGYCEFINNVTAKERVAIDLNPETRGRAARAVQVHILPAEELAKALPADHFDTIFMSNFLEHCRSRDQVLAVLRAAITVLKPGGHLLILGPNFRYCVRDYFDYFDHYLPLTERSVAEALELVGFDVRESMPRTLPFSFRSRLPSWPWAVGLYLRLPFIWNWFGSQFFVVATKESCAPSWQRMESSRLRSEVGRPAA
jgi:SAM-dependent methyltransferase